MVLVFNVFRIETIFIVAVIISTTASQSILWLCDTNEDCNSEVPNAICISELCTCPVGYVFSSDVSKCLKESLYGEPCEEGNQCSHMLTGSKCLDGACACSDGLTYLRGRCRKLKNLHSDCVDDAECWFGFDRESVGCIDNKCQCSEGFYNRDENICRRKSMNVNDTCVVNSDCVGDNLICSSATLLACVPNEQSVGSSIRRESRDFGVQAESDEIERLTASITTIATQSNDTKTVNSSGMRLFGESCQTNREPCAEFPHSICIQGVCRCAAGYYQQNGKCMAELGEIAESQEYCGMEKYDTVTKKCICDVNRFYGEDLRSCWKASNSIGFSCTQQSQCTPFGSAAYCSPPPKRCQCLPHADYDAVTQLCVPRKGLGSLCQTSTDCSVQRLNSVCDLSGLCVCRDNYVTVSDECKPSQNAECERDDDCAIENSNCVTDGDDVTLVPDDEIKRVCKCKKGYGYVADSCLKEATIYEDECTTQEQCTPLLGDLAQCIDKKCKCEDNHQYNDLKCHPKRRLGEPCARSSECFSVADPERIECRNGACECQFNYTRDLEKEICIRPKPSKASKGPSAFKIVALLLITAAILVTSAAINEAYF